jgi:hypothetical protein
MKDNKLTKDLSEEIKDIGDVIKEPSSKKNLFKSILLILFGVILGLFLGLAGGGIYFSAKYSKPKDCKINKPKEVDKSINKDNKTNIKLSEEEINYLYKLVSDERGGNFTSWVYGQDKDLFIKNMKESSRMSLVFQKLDEKDFTTRKTNLDVVTRDGYTYEYGYFNSEGINKIAKYISKDIVKNKYKEIFGSLDTFSLNIDMVADRASNILFIYSGTTDSYVSAIKAGGYENNYKVTKKMISSKEENKVLTIDEEVVGVDPTGGVEKEIVSYIFNYDDKNNKYIFNRRVVK